MNPILCHICGKPLRRVKSSEDIKYTHWKCVDNNYEDTNEFLDRRHCWISTLPKKGGIIIRYETLIQDKDKYFILSSSVCSDDYITSSALQRVHEKLARRPTALAVGGIANHKVDPLLL